MKLIESRNLPENATIRKAFELLSGTFGMVATIVDENGVLKGVVTDGDLRKALLSGRSIKTRLDEVMNTDPVVITLDNLKNIQNVKLVRARLEKRGVEFNAYGNMFAIPVIDSNNVVSGLTTLENLESFGRLEIQNTKNQHTGIPSVLVVGGAGYIGSVLVEKILKKGWFVKVLDNLMYKQAVMDRFKYNGNFSFIHGDVCNLNTQVEAIQNINCVVFLAEIVGDPSCQFIPTTALKTNYLAVNSMAALCSHMHITRFIYTSSCSVYGASSDPDITLDEASDLNPVSYYARMKISSEKALFGQANPLFAPTVLRLGTVFGISPRPRLDLVVNTFAKEAYLRGVLTVHGGNQWRPNVHVADVAETIIRTIEAPITDVARQIFNVGNETENYTIRKLAELVVEVYPGCRIEIDSSIGDSRNYRVNFGKLKKHLGYKPEITIRQGLEELKMAFKSRLIADLNSENYSNIEALKEHSLLAS